MYNWIYFYIKNPDRSRFYRRDCHRKYLEQTALLLVVYILYVDDAETWHFNKLNRFPETNWSRLTDQQTSKVNDPLMVTYKLITVIYIISDKKYYSRPIYFNVFMYFLYFVLFLIEQGLE